MSMLRVGSDSRGHGICVCTPAHVECMYVWVDSGLTHGYTMHVYITSGVSYTHTQIIQWVALMYFLLKK